MLDGKLRIAPIDHMLISPGAARGVNYEVPPIKDVCAQDLVAAAYKELMERQELQEEYGRVAAIAQKWGY